MEDYINEKIEQFELVKLPTINESNVTTIYNLYKNDIII